MIPLLEVVLLLVVLAAILVAVFRDPIVATALFAVFSLGVAIVWVLLAAPDVALTEAAVGAGVLVILLLIAAVKTGRDEADSSTRWRPSLDSVNLPALLVALAVGAPLSYTVGQFPALGDPTAASVSDVDPTGEPSPYAAYIGETAAAFDVPNAVALVLTVFRNFDTFGEVVVAFTAVVGVLIVLERATLTTTRANTHRDGSGGGLRFPDPYVMSPVGMTAVRLVVPLVFAFGVYLTVHGALTPGGGFQGGVVMGSSIVLMALVFGHAPTSDWLAERALVGALVGGLWLFLAIAVASIAFDGTLFEVAAYPLATIYLVDAIEVAIGLLVGGVVTALVVTTAAGVLRETREDSTADAVGGERP